MDITHVNGQHYLTLIDCGPSRFSVWRRLRIHSSSTVVSALEQVFFERGAPSKILKDNDSAFRSAEVEELLKRWGVCLRFRCAYVASSNGIAERSHWTVKEKVFYGSALYCYNVSPKIFRKVLLTKYFSLSSLHNYSVRVMGEDKVAGDDARDRVEEGAYRFKVGDSVWVKPDGVRCNTRFRLGKVTDVVSNQAVEVDGMNRHVRDLRSATVPNDCQGSSVKEDHEEIEYIVRWPFSDLLCDDKTLLIEDDGGGVTAVTPPSSEPRWSSRDVGPPDRYCAQLWD